MTFRRENLHIAEFNAPACSNIFVLRSVVCESHRNALFFDTTDFPVPTVNGSRIHRR